MNKIKDLLASRKFWLMISAEVGGFATEGKAFMSKGVAIFIGWLISQGLVDMGVKMNATSAPIIEVQPPK